MRIAALSGWILAAPNIAAKGVAFGTVPNPA